jgi:hypothetical protein
MKKGNRKRKHKKQSQRTGEERDLLKEREMERVEREDAQRRSKLPTKFLAARAGSDPPPTLGAPDTPVRAPLKPKPHFRSGAIALREPELEDAFFTVSPRSLLK